MQVKSPRPGLSSSSTDFFVGYLSVPGGLARWLRRWVIVLALAAPVLAGTVAAVQRPLPSGVFEFGVQRPFEGVLYETPVPMLHMADTSSDPDRPAARNLVLVGAGKFGLPDFASGNNGRKVRFSGSLIYRERMTMIEMNDPSTFEVLGDPEPWEARRRVEDLGTVTLEGEVVDTKCYFGVMRPATGKVHRACAVRCLSGGVPAGLLLRDFADNGVIVMLAGPPGAALELDVQWAARIVRAHGRLELADDLPVLRVESLELIDE